MLALLSACSGKKGLELEGLASYYAEPYHGRRTANGEVFDTYQAMTAAHRTLPFNTVVRVENKVNGKEVEVRINDRGPFIKGRIIDLSLRAARAHHGARSRVSRENQKSKTEDRASVHCVWDAPQCRPGQRLRKSSHCGRPGSVPR